MLEQMLYCKCQLSCICCVRKLSINSVLVWVCLPTSHRRMFPNTVMLVSHSAALPRKWPVSLQLLICV